MKKRKFLRPKTGRYKKFKRKKKQKWRRPKGHDSKVRLNRKGRIKGVKIGFRSSKKQRSRISCLVRNLKDADKIEKGQQVIIGKVGKKKRQEIERRIKERDGKILNLRTEKKK